MNRFVVLLLGVISLLILYAGYVFWSDKSSEKIILHSDETEVVEITDEVIESRDEINITREMDMEHYFIPPKKENKLEAMNREEKLRELDAESERIIAETDALIRESGVSIPDDVNTSERNETLEEMYKIVKEKLKEAGNEN